MSKPMKEPSEQSPSNTLEDTTDDLVKARQERASRNAIREYLINNSPVSDFRLYQVFALEQMRKDFSADVADLVGVATFLITERVLEAVIPLLEKAPLKKTRKKKIPKI